MRPDGLEHALPTIVIEGVAELVAELVEALRAARVPRPWPPRGTRSGGRAASWASRIAMGSRPGASVNL